MAPLAGVPLLLVGLLVSFQPPLTSTWPHLLEEGEY